MEIDKSLISNTRALLVSSPKGVPITKFNGDYRKFFGRNFPSRAHGFKTTMELLRVLETKGVLRIASSHNPQDGGWKVYGIPDTNNFVPSWFMKAHDMNTRHHSNSISNGNSVSRTLTECFDDRMSELHSEPNQLCKDVNGTVSVHVQWQCQEGFRKSFPMQNMKQTLFRLMSQVGDPLEVAVVDKFAFVRFGSINEAESAILHLNQKIIDHYKFTIKPAVPLKYAPKNKTNKTLYTPDKSSQRLIAAPLYISPKNSLTSIPNLRNHSHQGLNNIHSNTSPLVAGGYEEASSDDIESDCDSEWDDSLLSSVNNNSCTIDWYEVVTRFTGGVSWDTRITQLCGSNLAVNLVPNTLSQDCVYWIQVLESHEMKCFKSLQEYISFLTLSNLPCFPCIGELCCYSNQGLLCRGLVLEEGTNPQIFNIDNGNVTSVSVASLRVLPKWFSEFPMMAIPCQFESANVGLPQNGFGRAKITMPLESNCKTHLPLPLKIELQNELSQDALTPLSTPSHSNHLYSSTLVTPCSTIKSPSPCPSISSMTEFNSTCAWTFNQYTYNGLTSVHVSEVVSPGLFWIQVTKAASQDLKWMSDRIVESVITISKQQLTVGGLYGYKSDTLNYRVTIECFTNYEKSQVTVLCIDTGVKLYQVCIHNLYILLPFLTSKPPLVIPCKLHGAVSTRDDGLWWTLDNQLLWSTIRNKEVYVKYPSGFNSSRWPAQTIEEPLSLSVYLDHDGWDNVNEILTRDGHFIDFDH